MHASGIFNKTIKTWRKKTDIDKKYAINPPFTTQQEKYCLSNKPTSGTEGFSNAMVDEIINDKMKELINQMGPFYQDPSEEEPVNDKNCPHKISTLTSTNSVTM